MYIYGVAAFSVHCFWVLLGTSIWMFCLRSSGLFYFCCKSFI